MPDPVFYADPRTIYYLRGLSVGSNIKQNKKKFQKRGMDIRNAEKKILANGYLFK